MSKMTFVPQTCISEMWNARRTTENNAFAKLYFSSKLVNISFHALTSVLRPAMESCDIGGSSYKSQDE